MKPPPRTRSKPSHYVHESKPEEAPHRKWQRAELLKLTNALNRRSRAAGGNRDLDYDLLKNQVRGRSVSEIQSVVENAKDKVISSVSSKLRKKNKLRKPVELWSHLACVEAGSLEEPISTAFSQMLIVSSTEPLTLKNCDPPRVDTPPTDGKDPAARSDPRRPIQAKRRSTNAEPRLLALKAEAQKPSSPSQQHSSPTAGVAPPATSASQSAASPGSRSSAVEKTQRDHQTSDLIASPSLHTPICSSAPPTAPCPGASSAVSSCSSSPPFTRLSTSAAHVSVPDDDPGTPGATHVLDFERIYRYLSVIHKPNVNCHLTPMESAVVLDLLMSLPEEFSKLDCNRLQKHLVQVYQCLSSPADSDATWKTLRVLQGGRQDQTGTDSRDTVDRPTKTRGSDEAEGKLPGNNDTVSQSEDPDVMGLCPPLNPFMVPLKLMMHRK